MASMAKFEEVIKKHMDGLDDSNYALGFIVNGITSDSDSLTLLGLVENLGESFTSKETTIRGRATKLLSDVVNGVSPESLNTQEVELLMRFFCDKLEDSFTIQPHAVSGLLSLSLVTSLGSESIHTICREIFRSVHTQSLAQGHRNDIYTLLLNLLGSHLDSIRELGADFVCGFIQAMDGEKDPRNLLLAFRVAFIVSSNLPLGTFTEELFDVVSCYFPIDFHPPPSDTSGITKQCLVTALRQCLAATPKFAQYCMPLLLEKIDSDVQNARLDAFLTLAECAPVYGQTSLTPHLTSILTAVKKEVYNKDSEALANAASTALTSVIRTLSPLVILSGKKNSLEEFVDNIVIECRGNITDTRSSLLSPSCHIFEVVMAAESSACCRVVNTVVPLVLHKINDTTKEGEIKRMVEVLVRLLTAGKVFSHLDSVKSAWTVLKPDILRILQSSLKSNEASLGKACLDGLHVLVGLDILTEDDMCAVTKDLLSLDSVNRAETLQCLKEISTKSESTIEQIFIHTRKNLRSIFKSTNIPSDSKSKTDLQSNNNHDTQSKSEYLQSNLDISQCDSWSNSLQSNSDIPISDIKSNTDIESNSSDISQSKTDISQSNTANLKSNTDTLQSQMNHESAVKSLTDEVRRNIETLAAVCGSVVTVKRAVNDCFIPIMDSGVSTDIIEYIAKTLHEVLSTNIHDNLTLEYYQTTVLPYLLYKCLNRTNSINCPAECPIAPNIGRISQLLITNLDPDTSHELTQEIYNRIMSTSLGRDGMTLSADKSRELREDVINHRTVNCSGDNDKDGSVECVNGVTCEHVTQCECGDVILVYALAASHAKDIPKLPELLEHLRSVATTSPCSTTRLSAAKLFAALVNKMKSDDELDKLLSSVTNECVNQGTIPSDSHLTLWVWVTKALVLRAHPLADSFTNQLVSCLSEPDRGLVAGCGFAIIIADDDDVMNKRTRANIRYLYKQRCFQQNVTKIIDGFNACKNEACKSNYLLALSHLLQSQPQASLAQHMQSLLPMLLQSLDLDHPILLLQTLTTLSNVDSAHGIVKHIDSLTKRLLQLSQYTRSLEVRLKSLECLTTLTTLPYPAIHPLQRTIITSLEAPLNDAKRVVRNAAAKARRKWFLIGSS